MRSRRIIYVSVAVLVTGVVIAVRFFDSESFVEVSEIINKQLLKKRPTLSVSQKGCYKELEQITISGGLAKDVILATEEPMMLAELIAVFTYIMVTGIQFTDTLATV